MKVSDIHSLFALKEEVDGKEERQLTQIVWVAMFDESILAVHSVRRTRSAGVKQGVRLGRNRE